MGSVTAGDAERRKPPHPEFGGRLREAMTAAGLSNVQLAQAAKVDKVTVSQWRGGWQKPTGETLRAAAAAVNRPPAWLDHGDAPPGVPLEALTPNLPAVQRVVQAAQARLAVFAEQFAGDILKAAGEALSPAGAPDPLTADLAAIAARLRGATPPTPPAEDLAGSGEDPPGEPPTRRAAG